MVSFMFSVTWEKFIWNPICISRRRERNWKDSHEKTDSSICARSDRWNCLRSKQGRYTADTTGAADRQLLEANASGAALRPRKGFSGHADFDPEWDDRCDHPVQDEADRECLDRK